MQRFASARDTWLAALAWGAAVVCVVALAPLTVADTGWLLRIVIVLLVVFTVGLIGWVQLGTHYTIDDGELLICCGPFRWHVAIADIERVVATRSPLSSPALSLDRLRIEYAGSKWIMVSPARRDAFLAALGVTIES